MLNHFRQFCNICVITGIPLGVIGLSCDRIWNDGRYNKEETVPMWNRLNFAKEAQPYFASKSSFDEYCKTNRNSGHLIEQLVQILRAPITRLRTFQMSKI